MHTPTRCATIRSNHSWLTESKKRRMSASRTQFTYCVMSAVCNARNVVRTPARPESIGETHEVDLVDGAEHFGHRALNNLVFQGRNAEGSLTTIGFGGVHAAHRLGPVSSAMHAVTQVLQFPRQSLFVGRDRFPSTPAAAPRLSRPNARSSASTLTWCSNAVNRVLLSLLAASWTRASDGGRSFRLCVRSSVRSLSPSSGLPLPSTRLVSFGGFISTMSRSDSRPRLDSPLRSSLVTSPRRRRCRRTRSGLPGPDDDLSCVMRSTTPVERHRLASRRRTHGLPRALLLPLLLPVVHLNRENRVGFRRRNATAF
jgi:hypothetical protein